MRIRAYKTKFFSCYNLGINFCYLPDINWDEMMPEARTLAIQLNMIWWNFEVRVEF